MDFFRRAEPFGFVLLVHRPMDALLAFQARLHPHQHFFHRERFGEKIIRPLQHAEPRIGLMRLAGHDDHGDGRRFRPRTQIFEQFETRPPGHVHVGHNQIGRRREWKN